MFDDTIKKKLIGIISPPYFQQGNKPNIGDMTIGIKNRDYARNLYGDSPQNVSLLKDMNNIQEKSDSDITQLHSCDDSLWWHGCYSQNARFNQYVTPESFAHPAKMSWGLIDRIFKHLKQLGLLNKNDIIADFMAGSGRTGIMASLHGHDFVGVELEPHFIKMITDNKTLLERKIGRKVNWQVLQGDSRRLSEILQQNNLVGITSPPYQDMNHPAGNKNPDKFWEIASKKWKRVHYITSQRQMRQNEYSFNPHNIGNLNNKNKENLGNQQDESYLQAMLQVYSEAAKVIPVLVTVTKNPTRNGKLRRLDLDTTKLLMLAGYQVVNYHRNVLFEERKQTTLKGNIKKQLHGRLSFFKRLSVQKGNLAAQWEDVIIAAHKTAEPAYVVQTEACSGHSTSCIS